MKKFTLLLGMVLAALVLMPLSVKADKIYPQMSFVGADGGTVRQVEATLGTEFTAPTLTCDYPEVLRSVRYSSTNERVAMVDTLSGYVTPYSAGSTTITAYFAGNDTYGAARAMYTLIVNEATPIVEPTCPNAYFYVDGQPIKVLTIKVGETVSIPTLLGETGAVYRLSRKSIENSQVAMLTEDDMIYGVAEGSTGLIGYVTTTVDGQTLTCDYYLVINVEAATPIVEPTCPEAKYYYNGGELTTMTLKVGDVVNIPMLMGVTGAVYTLNAKTVEGIRVAELTENEAQEEVIKAVGVGTAQFIGMIVYTIDGQTKNCEYSFNIVVEAGETPQCPDAKFYYNGAIVESITLKVGDAINIPVLMEATGAQISGRANVENTSVATISADGLLYALAEGQTTYHVMYAQTTTAGGVLTCDYYLGVIVEAATPVLPDPELSFDATEVNIELGAQFVAPTLLNPHNIEFTAMNSKWYTNWDSKIASVNEQTGEVTLLGGVGKETITFEFTGNDTYKGGIASYVINVTTSGLYVGGVLVNSGNAGDILGDNGSIVYDPITHTLTMTNAAINGANINLTGTTTQVINAAIYYADNYPLTVVLNGGNAIANTDAGFYTENAPVVMMGGKDGGSIRISASTVGVKAEAYKIYQCSVTAYGGGAGIAVNELGVATGGNLVAQGGIAAQANNLVLAEDNDGEGIAILTAGVVFKKGTGFVNVTDGKQVAFVEIGKVVVVPTTTEVTTIDFTQTDPDGDETVIFSTSVNDTYNEETGQLEISTSLTDEQVATAMETLIPGSSEWIDMLPGSLVFDIPAGEGTVRIQCMTLPGYTLQVKMEGKAAVSLTQVSLGWAEVSYNVAEPVHVVIYLHAASGSAPARIAANMEDTDPTVGAYIQAVKIAPKDAPDPNPTTAIEIIEANQGENGKVLINGQFFIIRDGRVFTTTGAQMK